MTERDPPAPDSEPGPDPNGYFQPRVMRHLRDDGSIEFAIHDVYFTSDGAVEGYTQAARSPRTATVGELKLWVQEAEARGAPVVCGDLGYEHLPEHFAHWLQHVDAEPIHYQDDE